MKPTIAQGYVWEDTAAIFLARVVNADGDLLTTSNISSMVYTVYDAGVAVAGHNGASLTVADVIFDTVVTSGSDVHWPYPDSARGYNFKAIIAGTAWADADETRRIVFTATPTSGNDLRWVYQVTAQGLLT